MKASKKQTKKYKYLSIAVAVGLAVAGITYFCISGSSGISALEGKEIADKVASEWNSNAKIISVYGEKGSRTDGLANRWGYLYVNTTNGTLINYLLITVNEKHEIIEKREWVTERKIERYICSGPVRIDSTAAYKIALNNQTVANFQSWWITTNTCTLEWYLEDSLPERYAASINVNISNPFWCIVFFAQGALTEGIWMFIFIDAITGSVLYTYPYSEEPPCPEPPPLNYIGKLWRAYYPASVCIFPTMVIVALVLFWLLLKHLKKGHSTKHYKAYQELKQKLEEKK